MIDETDRVAVFPTFRAMLVEAGFSVEGQKKFTMTKTPTGTASKSTPSPKSVPHKKSGYNLYTRLLTEKYKAQGSQIAVYQVAGLWKTLSEQDKKSFNDAVDIVGFETDHELLDKLRQLIEVEQLETGFVPNYSWYLKVVKILKEKSVAHTKVKWSEMSETDRTTFFDTYKEYIPKN